MPDRTGWLMPAVALTLLVTALRIIGLAFDRTDLFVDESQYWVWGQNLDFGYYSKPPLIAWVIRAMTGIAGSEDSFWIRLPSPLFHAATALVLAATAVRLHDARTAVWVALIYLTLPFATVGSALISTDTIMAPFFALGLYFHTRLVGGGGAWSATLTGVSIGLAFLAKYAAVYFLVSAGLIALFIPSMRIGWRNAALMLAAFLTVISPNIAWNLSHDLTTVSHTMDNVGWVKSGGPGIVIKPASLADFALSQFAVFGPVLFTALLWLILRPGGPQSRILSLFALPPLIAVSAQALFDKAYANWAVAAYFAGTLIVVPVLLRRARCLLWASLALHGTLALALPVVIALAPGLTLGRDKPLLARYIGRADLSREIIAAARDRGLNTIVAADRDILADLFHTGRDSALAFASVPPAGRPQNYFQQVFPLSPDASGPVMTVLSAPPVCAGIARTPVVTFDTKGGAYADRSYAAYVVEASCVRP
jgi:4-amino-4-deoxy-L-arabinose transferase-like glycosyltransferase